MLGLTSGGSVVCCSSVEVRCGRNQWTSQTVPQYPPISQSGPVSYCGEDGGRESWEGGGVREMGEEWEEETGRE